MKREEIIYEYEQMLLGKKNMIDSEIFNRSAYGNEKLALEIFRYAIEEILKWTPKEAFNCLNAEIVTILKLKNIAKYIEFPPEFNPSKDYGYIAAIIYPDVIKISNKERVLMLYESILNGKTQRFPKRFLEGRDGDMRVAYCLKYAIQNYGTFTGVEDLYKTFSGDEGLRFLKKVKLHQCSSILFDYPIDHLHSCFSAEDQKNNEFLYAMYRFKAYDTDMIRKEAKRKEEAKAAALANAKADETETTAETNTEVVSEEVIVNTFATETKTTETV